ncbi:MAG: thioredoxin family protein [Oscillospiraceae bacterium]|nr:thioredoxin family protein [Oscillospiraceae bacterium]
MALFDFMKKSEEKKRPVDKALIAKIKNVKVLGAGCKNCHIQYENVKKALEAMSIPVEPEYITDMAKIAEYGVMSMPVIVVNEKVVSQGRVLKPSEVGKLLMEMK